MIKTPLEPFLNSIGSAGFEGVELWQDATLLYLQTHTIEDLTNLLSQNHLKVISWDAFEVSPICSDQEFQNKLNSAEHMMEIGNQIGCDMILTFPGSVGNASLSNEKIFEKIVERFQSYRKLGEKYAFKIGFEPLGSPSNSVRKIADALKILESAETDNLPPSGLIVDTFHFFVGEHHIPDLASIPPEKLYLIHFNDAPKKPIQKLHDKDRVLPGKGTFELKKFLTEARSLGYEDFLSLELFNKDFLKLPAPKAAKMAMNALDPFLMEKN
jgi:2-keto-myo-inositol isomerase